MKTKDYIFIGGITLLIFAGTYAVLALVGLVPEQWKISGGSAPEEEIEADSVINANSDTNTRPNPYDANIYAVQPGQTGQTAQSGQTQVQTTGQASTEVIVSGTNKPEIPADTNLIPESISIAKIGVSATIYVPASTHVDALDTALTKGAVYYPGSGTLQGGNMFLFGHSTNWTVVNNQAYKTFNGLEKLVAGDEITLKSNGKTYTYSVLTVRLADENSALVEFGKPGRMLTISTCDTFGAKDDRWVVEAELVRVV